ncbi:MAG: DUF63 family protein [Candidatus Aenigmarchaeota archaeon]|nr:DUF63 family protein [Candidatus Aenigmarchaeota archaeon]
MILKDFFYRYFVEPIEVGYGYNPVNTFVYAFAFVFFTYLLYKLFKHFQIKVDERLVLSIIPWIVFGIFIRLLEDSGILTSNLLVTPNIWFLFLFIIVAVLFASKFFEKKYQIPYFKIMFVSGTILSALLLPFLKIRNISGLIYFVLWFAPWLVFLKLIKWSAENKLVLSLHLFDATATFVSLQYFNYFEQHVLPRIIIELTGAPFSFVITKLIVVSGVLLVLDNHSDDKEFTNHLKLFIGILGFITGMRGLLRLVMFV